MKTILRYRIASVRWFVLLLAVGIALLPGGLSAQSLAFFVASALSIGFSIPCVLRAIYMHVCNRWTGSDFMRAELIDFFVWLLFAELGVYFMGVSARSEFCSWRFFMIVWVFSYLCFLYVMISVFNAWREYTNGDICFVNKNFFLGTLVSNSVVFVVSPFVRAPFWLWTVFIVVFQVIVFVRTTLQNLRCYGDRIDYRYEPPRGEYEKSDFFLFFPLVLLSLAYPLFDYFGRLGYDAHIRGVDAAFFQQTPPGEFSKWGDIAFSREVLEHCQDCRKKFCRQLIENGTAQSYVDILEHYAKKSPPHAKLLSDSKVFVRGADGKVLRPSYSPELDAIEVERRTRFATVGGRISEVQVSSELVSQISSNHNHAGRYLIAGDGRLPERLGEGYVFDLFLDNKGLPVTAFLSVRLRKIAVPLDDKMLDPVQPDISEVCCFREVANPDVRINDAIAESVLINGKAEGSRAEWIDKTCKESVLTADEVLRLYDDWSKEVEDAIRVGRLDRFAKDGLLQKMKDLLSGSSVSTSVSVFQILIWLWAGVGKIRSKFFELKGFIFASLRRGCED